MKKYVFFCFILVGLLFNHCAEEFEVDDTNAGQYFPENMTEKQVALDITEIEGTSFSII